MGIAPPPSSQTALKTPLTFPPAQQSQEPPASSPSATWASPTPPALPLTSFPLPGAPLAHMRMEPIFLELSLSALQLVLVSPLQPLLHCLRQQQLQQPVQLPHDHYSLNNNYCQYDHSIHHNRSSGH